MTKRAVTYARVSYDDSGTDGRNLDSQQEMCRDYIARQGYTLVDEIREDDKGASGADDDLPGLNRVFEYAAARAFDVLVVREMDRLARDLIKQLIVERDMKRSGIEIEYVLYQLPPGPVGDLARNMMGAVSEFVRQDAIKKTTRGRRNMVKGGSLIPLHGNNVNVAGRPPFGYQVGEERSDNGKVRRRWLEICEAEAGIVRMMFEWYTQGDGASGPLTINGITRRLQELGISTPSERNPLKGRNKKKESNEWNREVVHRMLKNATYKGEWYFGKRAKGGKVNPETHWLKVAVPAVIDEATWEAVQIRLEVNRRNGWKPTKSKYLLRGLVTCHKCGAACQCDSGSGRNGNYTYYMCSRRRKPTYYAGTCEARGFRAEQVDAKVWDWISGLLKKPETLQKALHEYEAECLREAAPIRDRLTTLNELISENQGQLDRVNDLYVMGRIKKDDLLEKTTRLEDVVGRLTTERNHQEARLGAGLQGSEQIKRVLEFARALGPNVDKATRDYAVRRGLMEDLQVSATLAEENGDKVIYARCVMGELSFRLASPTIHGEIQQPESAFILTARLSLADVLFSGVRKSAVTTEAVLP